MATLSTDGPLPPLVIRNKRGRKVDETLPKSHQREVQRQFRARRAAHLLDLERRVAILERENLILRHWAAVQPATRYLLGRGPTGCDTTKPLIADENDPEIQLFPENHSPNSNAASQEQNWPRTPTGAPSRASFVLDQQHQHAPPSAPESAHPTYVDDLRKPAHASASFDKSPYNQTVSNFPPNAHKYKPHPLYDTRPFDHLPPAPPAHFDQQSRLDTDRMLVKRENVYAPPAPPGNSLGSLPPRSDVPASQGASYYAVDTRGSFSRPTDSFSRDSNGHHAEMPPTPMSTNATAVPNHPLYTQSTSSWSDQFTTNPTSTPTPQMSTSRQQPVTPILPPNANGSVGNLSPASQATSNGNSSVPESRVHGMGVVPGYEQRRSVPYMMGGYNVPPSSTPTPTTYMSQSNQGQVQGLTYPAHLDNSQQHDGSTLSDSFRQ